LAIHCFRGDQKTLEKRGNSKRMRTLQGERRGPSAGKKKKQRRSPGAVLSHRSFRGGKRGGVRGKV